MATLNRAMIIGFLGVDPEIRYSQDGMAFANFSVATTERWKDNNGNEQERTEWHRVTFFGKQAEIAGEYLKKGMQVFVEGRIQTDSYTDDEGIERWSTKIMGQRFLMLGKREGSGQGGGERGGPPTTRPKPTNAPPARNPPPPPADPFPDDDIPF